MTTTKTVTSAGGQAAGEEAHVRIKLDFSELEDIHLRAFGRAIDPAWKAAPRGSNLERFWMSLTAGVTDVLICRAHEKRGERVLGAVGPVELRRLTPAEVPEAVRWLRHIGRTVPRAAGVVEALVGQIGQLDLALHGEHGGNA